MLNWLLLADLGVKETGLVADFIRSLKLLKRLQRVYLIKRLQLFLAEKIEASLIKS